MTDETVQYTVALSDAAGRDLEDIVNYIATHDGPAKAQYVLDRMQDLLAGLRTLPHRGAYPRELLELGVKEFRQTHFKPYRVVYQIVGEEVRVHLIADDRRNMQALLARRLLAG